MNHESLLKKILDLNLIDQLLLLSISSNTNSRIQFTVWNLYLLDVELKTLAAVGGGPYPLAIDVVPYDPDPPVDGVDALEQ